MLGRLPALVAAFALIPAAFTTVRADPLDTATRLYDNKDYQAASAELISYLSTNPDDEMVKQRAQLLLARTFVEMKYPAVAVSLFGKLMDSLRSSTVRNASLKWIVVAVERSRGPSDVLRSFRSDGGVDTHLDGEMREALHYHLGRDAAASKDFDDADKELGSIPMSSKFGSRARFELARSRFRAKDVEGAVKAGETAAKDPELALAVARDIATWTHRLGDSAAEVSAMRRIAGGETTGAPFAAFELSRLAVEDTAQVPGMTKLHGTTFADVITLATCPVIASDDVFPLALPLVQSTRESIRVLAKYEDDAELYDGVRKHKADLSPIVRLALDEPSTRELASYRDEIARELDQLRHTDEHWQEGPAAAEIQQELTVQLSVVEADLGKRFRSRLVALIGELDDIEKVVKTPLKLTAGPTVTPGTGFVVPDAACGSAKAAGQMPVAQNHGCAGCASTGAGGAGGWLVALAVPMIVWRRRRHRR